MARSAEACELTSSIVVLCSVQQCWDLYINNTLMPVWAPAVTQVECDTTQLSLGTLRKSSVNVDGKPGHTIEQCTLFDPLKRIEFTVSEETFGFSHMLNSYGYGVTFDVEDKQTLLVMKTTYVPKMIFASLMSSKTTQYQLIDLMTDTLNGFKHHVERLEATALM